jgi:hypothetical protein
MRLLNKCYLLRDNNFKNQLIHRNLSTEKLKFFGLDYVYKREKSF